MPARRNRQGLCIIPTSEILDYVVLNNAPLSVGTHDLSLLHPFFPFHQKLPAAQQFHLTDVSVVDDEEDDAAALVLELARDLGQQVHGRIAQALQIGLKLVVLQG